MLLLMFARPNRFDRRQGMKKQQTGKVCCLGVPDDALAQLSFSVPFMMAAWPGNEQKNA